MHADMARRSRHVGRGPEAARVTGTPPAGPLSLIGDVEHHVRTRLTAMIFSQPLLLSHLGSAGRPDNVSRAAETLRLGPRGRGPHSGRRGLRDGAAVLGFLRTEERGLVVVLARSKGSQEDAVDVVVPCTEMPTASAAVEAWVERANLQPGEPVFRPIDKGQRIGADRLTDHSVSRIIKARVRAYAIANGMSKAEAAELVARVSGHSLRAGYATAAAAKDVPSYRIQQHTRHKSAEMVARYIREADKWTKNGLKGVGF
jgi:hypothetical protein